MDSYTLIYQLPDQDECTGDKYTFDQFNKREEKLVINQAHGIYQYVQFKKRWNCLFMSFAQELAKGWGVRIRGLMFGGIGRCLNYLQ